MEAEISSETM